MKCWYSSEKKDILIYQKLCGVMVEEHIQLLIKMVNMVLHNCAIVDDNDKLNNIKLSLENTQFIKLMEYVKFNVINIIIKYFII